MRRPTGGRPRTGRIGPMRRGEVWFAEAPGGDRPVLVLTREPLAGRIGAVVVAALTRVERSLVSACDDNQAERIRLQTRLARINDPTVGETSAARIPGEARRIAALVAALSPVEERSKVRKLLAQSLRDVPEDWRRRRRSSGTSRRGSCSRKCRYTTIGP